MALLPEQPLRRPVGSGKLAQRSRHRQRCGARVEFQIGQMITVAIDHEQFPVEGRERLGQRRHPRRHDAIGLRPLAGDVGGTQLLQRLATRIQREQRDAREGGPAFAQPQAGDQGA
ncbi:hypothetical protein D3C78_1297850 [compost metagenome]